MLLQKKTVASINYEKLSQGILMMCLKLMRKVYAFLLLESDCFMFHIEHFKVTVPLVASRLESHKSMFYLEHVEATMINHFTFITLVFGLESMIINSVLVW
jgi:hypothetical protein